MTEYEQRRLERAAMERSEQLGEEIADVARGLGAQAGRRQRPGRPEPETGLPPEANETTQGDPPPDAGEREPWPDE